MSHQRTTRSALRALPLRRLLASRFVQNLTYPHGVDHYLAPLDATWSLTEVRAAVTTIRQQTHDSVTVTLAPNDNWRGFCAGQYVRVSVDVAGVCHTRCFSPANSARTAGGALELTCRIGPRSVVSRYFATTCKVGDVVRMAPAEGTFALPETRPAQVLFISGGSGITPVMAMLRTLLDDGHTGRIVFLHYARTRADQLYAAELAALAQQHANLRVLPVYTREVGTGADGHFDAAQLDAGVPGWTQMEAFLCGPAGLIAAVQDVFAARGVAQRLHVERFAVTEKVGAVAAPIAGEVRYVRSERVAENRGANLLDQAEAAGLHPECGCRMGICHSCTTRKLSGRVRDLCTGEVSGTGEEDIQLCVCAPVGTVTLDL
ncbi:MAG: ferredoxin reductase [Nevskiaceae bacterium]|nr:MAG: ferredoxin reductase [Nevskiaceae bacterium]TBR71520.1 MAG: ferredoxin reductase [Nevskiaceae bacterium]